MLAIGGLRFEIEPQALLTSEERASLARLAGPGSSAPAAFGIELLPHPPWRAFDPDAFPLGEPARVDWTEGRVRVSHHDFAAELDPLRLAGRLFRRAERAYALEVTLRVALCSRLPLEGGLPLHAAGLVVGGRGVVFFGPSGAGKSTLAGLSPYPVLSDEMVAVLPGRPFELRSTGFWGTLGSRDASMGQYPLAALVELDRGPGFALTTLSPREALRRLLGVMLVPVGPPLWSAALAVAGRLAREVPVHRMSWSPAAPPWDQLGAIFPV